MNQKIRIIRDSAVDRLTTEVEVHHVRDGSTELIIDQSRYDNFKDKYSPRRMMIFSLSPEQRQELIRQLSTPAG